MKEYAYIHEEGQLPAPLDAVPADDAAAADVPVTEAVIDAGPTPQE